MTRQCRVWQASQRRSRCRPGHVDNTAGRVKFGTKGAATASDHEGFTAAQDCGPTENAMATAEQHTSPQAAPASAEKTWHDIVLQTLKRNEVSLVPYVPDRVLTPLIKALHADPY